MAVLRWCWALCRRVPAMRKLRCSSPATSIIWLRPTRWAWGSTSTSITSPSPPTANMTAINSAASILPNSRRSPAAPAAPPATATSAPPAARRAGPLGPPGRCAPFEPELVNALQNHTFDSVKVLQWRNSKLDFSSLGALQVSLALTPTHEALPRAPSAEDLRVLDHAARDADVREMAHGAAAVERLWDACQIPDYRKIAPAAHAELVTTLFGFLMKQGRIPDAWFAAQVEQADRVDGDIDTLSSRIAQIRTLTFVANRPDWLADPEHWQGIARDVENKLSAALHGRLTGGLLDRRTRVLMRRHA